MDSVFIASSFHPPDRDLVDEVASIVTAFGMRPVQGRNLGGMPLEPAVKQRLEDCDGLVALFTRRKQKDQWVTHPWVMGEFGHAVSQKMKAIAIVDAGIDWSTTMWADRERIRLDAAAPAKAMLQLVRELGEWKRDAGMTLTAVLTSVDVLSRHWTYPQLFRVRYRCVAQARLESWRETNRIYRDGEALVIGLPGIPSPDHLVEMEVECGQKKWRSTAVRQFVPVQLTEVVVP
jgi:hypothetical protein